ncbi:MAG: DUF805 domain-containing protein [Phenylobacterium sp.]|nr:MAG: DUF805 domain-containing protein [Phenylobacterium sp.]
MEGIKLEFTFRGRATRNTYWSAVLIAVFGGGALLGLEVAIVVLGLTEGAMISSAIVALILLVFFAAKVVRRLHDRDKSGAWIVVFWVAPIVLRELTKGSLDTTSVARGVLASALNVASLVLVVWGQVELGFLRGTRGANRFGDDPLRPGGEVFA